MSTNLKVDLESYAKQWWSGKPLKEDLSTVDPLTFWNALFSYGDPCKSIPFESYDFYHDCIIRHLDKDPLAVIAGKTWSYSQIHALVSSQVPIWKGFGLSAGQKVTLAVPQGIDFVVALMTALRLGLTVSILPLDDPYLGPNKVKRLDNDTVVTLPSHKELWETVLEWELGEKEEIDLASPSHVYGAGDPVFDDLDANGAFLCPFRDGLLTLPLKKGTVWARPLSSMLHDEPFATLTALLAGATLYHVSDSVLLDDPECLKNERIEVLGISSRLYELWTKTPGCPHGKLLFWYKTPLLGNLMAWETFSESNNLKKISHSDLLIQPERGGITLASKPKPYGGLTLLRPNLGIPWKILDLNGSGDETHEGVGFFDLNPKLILGEVQGSFVISKPYHPIHKGSYYPTQEVELFVDGLDFVLGCIAMDDRDPKDSVGSQISLLIFISPEKKFAKTALWEEKIRTTIREEVGAAFLPDRILFYPLYPYRVDGQLHRNWAMGQYQEGLLSKKTKSSLYHQLNMFRHSMYKTLAGV